MPSLAPISGQPVSSLGDLTHALVSNLLLSDSLTIFGPISSELDLTHSMRVLQWPMRLIDTLSLADSLTIIRQYALSQNIFITHQMVASNNNQQDLASNLSITDILDLNQRYVQPLSNNLSLSQNLNTQIFPTMFSDLSLTQAVQLVVIYNAHTSHGLSLNQDLTFELFKVQTPGQMLSLTHSLGLLRVITNSLTSTLALSQVLTAINLTVQNLVSSLNFNQNLSTSNGTFIELCSCIDLTDVMKVPYELTITSTLMLTDFLNPNHLLSVLILSHLLETNALASRCCDGTDAYVPDKLLKSTLTLSHTLGQSADSTNAPETDLALNQSLGYFVVRP